MQTTKYDPSEFSGVVLFAIDLKQLAKYFISSQSFEQMTS